MSSVNQCNDDLTTDALPNPRNTQDVEGAQEKPDNTDTDENFTKNTDYIPTNSYSNFNTRKKSNPRKFSPPAASATIINISRSRDVHVGNSNTYNFFKNEKGKKTDIPETAAIRTLLESTKIVSKDDIKFVSTHMDAEWKNVGRALGLGDGQISQFIADHHRYGTQEVIYQVLLDWYQSNPTEATVGRLCTILWNNDEKSVVQRWSLGQA